MARSESDLTLRLQAGQFMAARPASAPAARAYAGLCGSLQMAAIVLRVLRQPACRRVTGCLQVFSCLLACLVGALEDYAVVSRDLVSDLGGSSMREKRTRI